MIAWLVLIFWLSSQPVLPGVGTPGTDAIFKKAAHVVVYAALALLLVWAIHDPAAPITRRTLWLAFGLSVGYAVTDEIHQAFVPGRGSHVTDVLLDGAAAALALGSLAGWTRVRRTGRAALLKVPSVGHLGQPGAALPAPIASVTIADSQAGADSGDRSGQRGPRQEGYR